MDFSQFTAPEKPKKERIRKRELLSETSPSKGPDYKLLIKKKINWAGDKYTLKIIHIKENYTEALVTCKPDKLDKMKEKMLKQYRRLGTVVVDDKSQDDNDDTRDD